MCIMAKKNKKDDKKNPVEKPGLKASPAVLQEKALDKLPNSHLKIIKGANHVFEGYEDKLFASIISFLKKIK